MINRDTADNIILNRGGVLPRSRPKDPVRGIFVDSKYNPVIEGNTPFPQQMTAESQLL